MNSRQRLLTTLNHQEPDRIPLDLGATQVTGMRKRVYTALRHRLGLPSQETVLIDHIQGLAMIADDLVVHLGVDVRGLFPLNSHNWNVTEQAEADYWVYQDEWGITHRRPYPDGLYYSISKEPLNQPDLSAAQIQNYNWPDFGEPWRIDGLRAQAQAYQIISPNMFRKQIKPHWQVVFDHIKQLAPGGGYVFNTVHNIQTDVPVENILAMVDACRNLEHIDA
jgi:uroporphyrinogen decarboxylase